MYSINLLQDLLNLVEYHIDGLREELPEHCESKKELRKCAKEVQVMFDLHEQMEAALERINQA